MRRGDGLEAGLGSRTRLGNPMFRTGEREKEIDREKGGGEKETEKGREREKERMAVN